jgi:hypothetical protein
MNMDDQGTGIREQGIAPGTPAGGAKSEVPPFQFTF